MGDFWRTIIPAQLRRWVGFGLVILLASGIVAPRPAQAGIFDFLFGGRENRRGRPPNRDKGGAVRAGRLAGGTDATIPYIITPRNTFQASDQFTIRWQAVPDVTTYTVRLWQWEDSNGGRQQVIWETTTPDSSVLYEGNPPLAPESFYSVEVITDQGVSSDLDAGCSISGFAVLFPAAQAQLQADLRGVNASTLSAAELALAQAQIYLNHQMPEAAIAALTSQFDLAPTAPLALALGDLYSYAGLNALAIESYTQGLGLARASQDDFWQAIALEGLGEVTVIFNQIDAALPLLQQAELHYLRADLPINANLVKRRIQILQLGQQMAIPATDELQGCDAREIAL